MKTVTGVRGWLTAEEGVCLERLAYNRRVLEIGTFAGRSTIHLARAASAVVAVDPGDGRTTPEPGDLRVELMANLARYRVANKVRIITDTIENTASSFGPQFDLIFVDAGHSRAETESVIDAAAPLAGSGCMWVFHDHSNPDFPEVKLATWAMLRREPTGESGTLAIFDSVGTPPARVLNVVTPLSRPMNLSRLSAAIIELRNAMKGFSVRWFVATHQGIMLSANELPRMTTLLEAPEPNHYGNDGRNECLKQIESGLVWFMDDDTKPHDRFGLALAAAVRANPDAGAFVFPLLNADGSHRLGADPDAVPGQIDTAQFVFHRDVIGDVKWNRFVYAADGEFFETVRKRVTPVAVFDGAVYYNALR